MDAGINCDDGCFCTGRQRAHRYDDEFVSMCLFFDGSTLSESEGVSRLSAVVDVSTFSCLSAYMYASYLKVVHLSLMTSWCLKFLLNFLAIFKSVNQRIILVRLKKKKKEALLGTWNSVTYLLNNTVNQHIHSRVYNIFLRASYYRSFLNLSSKPLSSWMDESFDQVLQTESFLTSTHSHVNETDAYTLIAAYDTHNQRLCLSIISQSNLKKNPIYFLMFNCFTL